MQGVIKPDYVSTSLIIPKPVKRAIDVWHTLNGTNHTQIYMAVMKALLTGDLKIEPRDYGEIRIVHSVAKELDDYYTVVLYDREGKQINHGKFADVIEGVNEI